MVLGLEDDFDEISGVIGRLALLPTVAVLDAITAADAMEGDGALEDVSDDPEMTRGLEDFAFGASSSGSILYDSKCLFLYFSKR